MANEKSENDEDPFDMFGDDDSDSDSDSDSDCSDSNNDGTNDNNPGTNKDKKAAVSLKTALIEKANASIASSNNKDNNPTKDHDNYNDNSSSSDDAMFDLSTLQVLDMSVFPSLPCRWPEPLYKSPHIQLVSNLPHIGGGRGYVATKTLSPGTLVLIEEPAMQWSPTLGNSIDTQMLSVIQQLLVQYPTLVKQMEEFHPTKNQVDQIMMIMTKKDSANDNEQQQQQQDYEQIYKMIKYMQQQYPKQDIENLVRLGNKINNDNESGSTNDNNYTVHDILRLILAIRYNGLESGIYHHVAMLNHSCQANCVKLLPTNNDNNIYSEVRATRTIRPGEPLTIYYLGRIVCHASRRKYLWNQHRFDIGSIPIENHKILSQMELVNSNLPPLMKLNSTINDSDTNKASQEEEEDSTSTIITPKLFNIEKATLELQYLFQEDSMDIQNNNINNNDNNNMQQVWEHVKALEVSTLQLYTESIEQIQNDKHVILLPILKLHLEICHLLTSSITKTTTLTMSQYHGVLCRLISTATKLKTLQQLFHGKDHFDLASTNLDLAHSIEEMLHSTSATKILIQNNTNNNNDNNINNNNTVVAWSKSASQARQEYRRIQALYPFDADKYINDR